MSSVPSRLPRKSSSKNTLPKIPRISYYRCGHCGYVGIIVTASARFNCGGKRCREYLRLSEVKVKEGVYRKVWG